ncbi:hypothetical protein DFJ73DRAFT_914022 [Zopfochytrium polystomum]|nr:hypothetical protein DFJ73DRAFT_914022 [Zopfochytrium polystomum]
MADNRRCSCCCSLAATAARTSRSSSCRPQPSSPSPSCSHQRSRRPSTLIKIAAAAAVSSLIFAAIAHPAVALPQSGAFSASVETVATTTSSAAPVPTAPSDLVNRSAKPLVDVNGCPFYHVDSIGLQNNWLSATGRAKPNFNNVTKTTGDSTDEIWSVRTNTTSLWQFSWSATSAADNPNATLASATGSYQLLSVKHSALQLASSQMFLYNSLSATVDVLTYGWLSPLETPDRSHAPRSVPLPSGSDQIVSITPLDNYFGVFVATAKKIWWVPVSESYQAGPPSVTVGRNLTAQPWPSVLVFDADNATAPGSGSGTNGNSTATSSSPSTSLTSTSAASSSTESTSASFAPLVLRHTGNCLLFRLLLNHLIRDRVVPIRHLRGTPRSSGGGVSNDHLELVACNRLFLPLCPVVDGDTQLYHVQRAPVPRSGTIHELYTALGQHGLLLLVVDVTAANDVASLVLQRLLVAIAFISQLVLSLLILKPGHFGVTDVDEQHGDRDLVHRVLDHSHHDRAGTPTDPDHPDLFPARQPADHSQHDHDQSARPAALAVNPRTNQLYLAVSATTAASAVLSGVLVYTPPSSLLSSFASSSGGRAQQYALSQWIHTSFAVLSSLEVDNDGTRVYVAGGDGAGTGKVEVADVSGERGSGAAGRVAGVWRAVAVSVAVAAAVPYLF